ncbi:hypothetical protein [Haloarchaeobius amylolyticus]|uniref:hypothetical protein n=1 Tax=Haloarchaeobius amylolyticus TaxID=1198296 RepID=UPI00226F4F4B|nr:hypothetical protein [Haloarchaeobius amylolyticus]
MVDYPRRKVLQLSGAALPTLTGCVSSEQSTETANVEVEIAVENNAGEYYQADIVVLDQHKTKVFGRNGVGWDDGSAIRYRTKVPKDRASELEVTVFISEQSTTKLFDKVVTPTYTSDTVTIDVIVNPGPEVDIQA